MISSISLKNFKCFTDRTIDLSEINVLAGGNAVGKSSIIQGILLAEETYKSDDRSRINKIRKITHGIGSLKGFVSQNPMFLEDGDFQITVSDSCGQTIFTYSLDRKDLVHLSAKVESPNGWNVNIIYLQAERVGPRLGYKADDYNTLRADGSNAAYIIDHADLDPNRIPKDLSVAGIGQKLSRQVEGWLSYIFGTDTHISVSTEMSRIETNVLYRNDIVDEGVVPPMTGFGISYVMPIIVGGLCAASEKEAVFIVENPEAHLHPSAQSRVGGFLYALSKTSVQIIVETHSEHIIDGIRAQAASEKNTEGVNIFYMEKKGANVDVEKIKINSFGELDRWPKGFFDQKSIDLKRIFDLGRNMNDHQ